MRFRLADEDRERLGITTEWVELDLDTLDMIECEELDESGYKGGLGQFLDDVNGIDRLGPDGDPVMVAVLDGDGNAVLDDDGQPKLRPIKDRPARATRALVWLAARRAGCVVPLSEFRFQALKFRTDAGADGGKGGTVDSASEKSDDAT
jgi:hypothetical protein